MSAFIVQDKTINRIVSNLKESDFLKSGSYLVQDLAQKMFDLNCKAIEQRYGAGQAEKFRPLKFIFKKEECSEIQALKSLNCWLYQCMEGDIPKTSKLYKFFDALSGDWANSIVAKITAYSNAEWD